MLAAHCWNHQVAGVSHEEGSGKQLTEVAENGISLAQVHIIVNQTRTLAKLVPAKGRHRERESQAGLMSLCMPMPHVQRQQAENTGAHLVRSLFISA